MPTIADFLRSTPPASLRSYFTATNSSLPPDVVWDGPPSKVVPPLLRAVDAMDAVSRVRVIADADRVGVMASEAGQAALDAVAKNPEILDLLENGNARALWMFLNDPVGFDRAEEVRYADDRRHGRMWDGFASQAGLTVARSGDALTTFKTSVGKRFASPNVEVEICDRSRPSLDDGDAQLIQAAIYREGRPGDRRVFIEGKLDRIPSTDVIEAAITYEPASGTIEVVAQARETREDLVRLFARHLLNAPFKGQRIPVRQYRLEHLKQPFDFPTIQEDNIERVRVTHMRLMPLDTQGKRITLECMRGCEETIWQLAEAHLKDQEYGIAGYMITQVRFTIKFRAVPGLRGGRTLPVTISMPQGCDLKDRTERERVIGDKVPAEMGICPRCLTTARCLAPRQ